MLPRATACLALGGLLLAATPRAARAAAPTGHLDAPDAGRPLTVGGWARDPDHPGPIPVHIYIDGELVHDLVADGLRPDLPFPDQAHGFTWIAPPQGAGTHSVVAYAIGVDAAGVPDGENPGLPGSPATIAQGCAGFIPAVSDWCAGVPGYFSNRAADTRYLYSRTLRVGVNASFGGTIFELYGAGHDRNLVLEHGGGAVQLSIWGYEPVGPDAFFATGAGVCDPTPFPTAAACTGAGHASCRLWCCSQGAHVADCGAVRSCVDWGAGAPWNPIQAQAADCGWDSPTNDVDSIVEGAGTITIRKSAPWHFTKSTNMPGVAFEQTATLREACVQLDYRVTYAGPYTLTPHPQEIPAIFPGAGMNHTYVYYDGDAPYQVPPAAPTTVAAGSGLMLRLKDRGPYPHAEVSAYLSENWITACDSTLASCLTVAFFSPAFRELNAAGYPGSGYGYLTPLGAFGLAPGTDERFTVYLFPYRHDQEVAGKTVRAWIRELAGASGCQAHGYPCDDGNECTVPDRCDGLGGCAGTAVADWTACSAGYCQAGVCTPPPGWPDATPRPDAAIPWVDAPSGRDAGERDGALPGSPDGPPGGGADGLTGGCGCRATGREPGRAANAPAPAPGAGARGPALLALAALLLAGATGRPRPRARRRAASAPGAPGRARSGR